MKHEGLKLKNSALETLKSGQFIYFAQIVQLSAVNMYSVIPNLTWWALHMRSKSWRFKNLLTTSAPNVKETPLSFSPQPFVSLSGSDQSKSQRRPVGIRGKNQSVRENWKKRFNLEKEKVAYENTVVTQEKSETCTQLSANNVYIKLRNKWLHISWSRLNSWISNNIVSFRSVVSIT